MLAPSVTPRTALATASATARSAPGSSTRTPPATLTNTSARARADARVAAEHGEHERQPVAVDPVGTRRGGTSSDGDTSAWTSTSSGREPSIAASTTLPGARVASPTKRADASCDLDQAAGAHLEHADVVGRAEAVLQRPQRAVGALALALELQHAVDQVLEHPRAGQRALLGDVADEQHGDPARLGEPRDPVGDLAHLADASPPRRSGPRACSVCTESITQTSGRSGSSVASTVSRSVSASTGPAARPRAAARPAAGSAPPTPRRRRTASAGPAPSRLPERHRRERRLADAGRAADQHERAGHEAAAEDAVELADPGLQPRVARRLDVGEPQRLGRAARAPRRRAASAAPRGLLGERVPLAAAGALAHPARRFGAAGGADEDGGGAGHGLLTVGAASDEFAPVRESGLSATRLRRRVTEWSAPDGWAPGRGNVARW